MDSSPSLPHTGCEPVLSRVGRNTNRDSESHTKALSLTGSLGGLVSELILNAKREMGAVWRVGWQGGGRAQILSGLLGCHRSCSEQVLQSRRRPRTRPASGTHTKCACIIQAASHALRSSSTHLHVRPSFPKSPLLRITNKQGGSLYSHFVGAAGRIHSHNRKSCTCCRKILF